MNRFVQINTCVKLS